MNFVSFEFAVFLAVVYVKLDSPGQMFPSENRRQAYASDSTGEEGELPERRRS